MDRVTVKPEQVEKAILKALAEYGDEASKDLETITKTTARSASKELKSSAPAGGKYAKGWGQRAVGSGAYKKTYVVYNRLYQLVHLLEKPHSTGRYKGGSYPKKVDYTGTVARVEDEYTQKYYEEVIAKL